MQAIHQPGKITFITQIVRLLPGHVYWKDKEGRFLGCNDEQAKTFQLASPEAIVGTTDFDYYPKEQAKAIVQNDQYVMATHQLQTLEETAILPGQGEKTYLSKKIPLINDADEVVGILGVSLDITDRKSLEVAIKSAKEDAEDTNRFNSRFMAKLVAEVTGKKIDATQTPLESAEEMRDYLENIIAAIPGHVYWHDRNMVFLGCNDLQAKHAGLKSRKEIVGKTLDQMLDPKIAAALNKANTKVMETGQAVLNEEFAVMENGPGYYLSHKVPLRDRKSNIIGVLGLSFDITSRKQEEKTLKKAKQYAEEASQAKSKFIANMSHDVRTPLTGILGMAESLAGRVSTQEDKALADNLIRSSKRLSCLLNEILEFAALDTKQQQVMRAPIRVQELIQSVIELIQPDAEQKSITLRFHCADEVPQWIISDSLRLNRILLNLIGNALRFTHTGSVDVSVGVSDAEMPQLVIRVKDTGIGIPQEKLGEIFEPFCKLSASYEGKYAGTGLGLHIVKQFIAALEGEVIVKSVFGKGSVFTVTLPLLLPSKMQLKQLQTQEKVSESLASTQEGSALRILLVEDDYICQRVAQVMLTDLNHQVDVASSGEEALNKLQHQYDLVLMDVGLPDTNGILLTEEIRSKAGANQHTRIIALTAHVSRTHKQQFLEAGMNAVLFKPFSIQELKTILNGQVAT